MYSGVRLRFAVQFGRSFEFLLDSSQSMEVALARLFSVGVVFWGLNSA